MNKAEYDVAVIGSGPGGYVAAIRAAQLGFKTVCIEKDRSLGGTCLNVGCIPSKSLLQSSEYYAWLKEDSQSHGISFSNLQINWNEILGRKNKIVSGLTEGISILFKAHSVDRIQGKASFISPYELEVKQEQGLMRLQAKSIILATGSEPIPLSFLPFDEERILSSTGALALKSIPKKMLVIGGGVIGVELASVYQRLNTEVTIIEMLPDICVSMDSSVRKSLLQSLKKQGITFYLDSKVTASESDVSKKNDQVKITIQQNGQEHALESDVVLVAIGRRPFTRDLNLEKIGISTNKGFIPIDGNFRTKWPHIYAIGDLIPGPMLAHKASEEGVVVAELIAGKAASINYMAIPNVIYTHPEAACVGLTEDEAQASGLNIKIGRSSFKINPRARCLGFTEGFVKVIGAGKDNILIGMHIVGPQASELINAGVVAIEKKITLDELANSPTAHPTLSESIKEAAIHALET